MKVMVIAALASSAFAQTGNGSIGGTVQDPSKALIPGVTVTATNVDTNVSQTQITNETGAYNFLVLPPGTYQITADLPGFRKEQVNDVRLGYAGQQRIDITLQLGQSTDTVNVVIGADSILRDSSASVADVLTQDRIQDLPIVGNNVLNLLDTLPGMRLSAGGDQFNTITGLGMDTVNATRDGMTTVDSRYNYQGYGRNVLTATTLLPDLVGEVRLIVSPVDAELGRGNAQIQIRTRSGTNRYTGSSSWNVRNTALDANTWTNNHTLINGKATPLTWRNNNQYTIAYGGPIKIPHVYNGTNKTFFYALFDQNISNTRDTQNSNVLTDSAREGILRYFTGYNPAGFNPNATIPAPSFPLTAGTATLVAVDLNGNPVAPARNPDGTPYTGGLRCFSVFGNQRLEVDNNFKLTGKMVPFTDADCPGGTAVLGPATGVWDSNRTTFDQSGLILKVMNAMPRANYFGANDGLNSAQFRWQRRRDGNNSIGAEVGTDLFVNTKQINLKIDHNFNASNKAAVSWTYQQDDSGFNQANWPGGVWGSIVRHPEVLTVNFTSTVSSRIVNEARFGLNYNPETSLPAYFSSDPKVKSAAENFLLPAGQSVLNPQYRYLAVVGTGFGGSTTGGTAPIGDTSGPMATTSATDVITHNNLWNYADTLSFAKGKHSFRGGLELRLPRTAGNGALQPYPTVTLGNNTAAASTNSPFAAATNFSTELPGLLATAVNGGNGMRATATNLLYFLNGSVSSATQNYWINSSTNVSSGKWSDYSTSGDRLRNQIQKEWAAFIKDDFKVTRRLTLNLGVRWEFRAAPYIDSGFTAAVLGFGYGAFGATRGARGTTTNPFAGFMTPGNLFLTGYGSNPSTTPLSCQNGIQQNALLPTSTCDPNSLSTIQFVGPNSPNPKKAAEPVNYHDIGPAIGFAYSLPWFGEGKTTIRGGFQRTFGVAGRNGSSAFGGTEAEIANAPGAALAASTSIGDTAYQSILSKRALNLSDIQSLVPVRPTSNPGAPVPVYGRTVSPTVYDPNFKTPYTDNVTFSITRQINSRITLDLRYIGTFARRQQGNVDINLNNVYHNPELYQALTDARAGKCTASAYPGYTNPCDAAGDPVILDQLLAGLNLNVGATSTDAAGVTRTFGPVGTVVNGVFQSGAAQMRRSATFQANLSNGDFSNVAGVVGAFGTTGLLGLIPSAQQGRQTPPIDPATGNQIASVALVTQRNGCDRIANGYSIVQQTTPGGAQVPNSGAAIPLRCFPEDWISANPQYGTVTYNANLGHTNYHSMQTSITARPINGISTQFTWVWAHAMQLGTGGYFDPANRNLNFTAEAQNVHQFRMNGVVELPVGPNKFLLGGTHGVVGRLLEKWQTGFIFNAATGTPTTLNPGTAHLYAASGYDIASVNWKNPKPNVHWAGNTGSMYPTYYQKATNTYSPYYVGVPDPQCTDPNFVTQGDKMGTSLGLASTNPTTGAAIAAVCTITALSKGNPDGTPGEILLRYPTPGHVGNLGQNTIKYFGQWSLDMNASKTIKVSENKSFQIRIDATNVLNHPVPDFPSLSAAGPLGNIAGKNPDPNPLVFGGLTYNARQLQGQLRINF
jgi:hypothetical protein